MKHSINTSLQRFFNINILFVVNLNHYIKIFFLILEGNDIQIFKLVNNYHFTKLFQYQGTVSLKHLNNSYPINTILICYVCYLGHLIWSQ